MKKITFIAAVLSVFFVNGLIFAGEKEAASPKIIESPQVKIIINGNEIKPENVPINTQSRILLPLRDILTNLGVQNDDDHIIWNSVKRSVTVKKDSTTINLAIGNKQASVNEAVYTLDVPPLIYKNRTYIPTRFVSESLDKVVNWDSAANSVFITDRDKVETADKVVGILSMVLNSMENTPITYQADSAVSVKTEAGSEQNYDMAITRKTVFDNKNGSYSKESTFKRKAGTEESFVQYLADKTMYTKINMEGGSGWVKEDVSQNIGNSKRLFMETDFLKDLLNSEALAILKVDEKLSTDNITVISGDTYPESFRQKNLQHIPFVPQMTTKSCSTVLYIDKKTGCLTKSEIKVKYEMELGEGKTVIEAVEEINFTDFNKDVKIELPKEIK